MKYIAALSLVLTTIGNGESRLFFNRHDSAQTRDHEDWAVSNNLFPNDDRRRNRLPRAYSSRDPFLEATEMTGSLPSPEESQAVYRSMNQVRITLTGVDDKMDSLSSAETIFLENCFTEAFSETQEQDDSDANARSFIVLSDTSSTDAKNNLRGRSLWTPVKYFDISALLEWSCYLCTNTRGTATDDYYSDDDFYYKGPKDARTAYPTASPTAYHRLDDDFTDDDFYYNGPSSNTGKTNLAASSEEDDIVYLGGDIHSQGDKWVLGSSLQNDGAFSFLFGKRKLGEKIENLFEDGLCRKLRDGPFEAFHSVKGCFVVFKA